jgi:flagellar hook-length control protein FliK
MINGLNVGSQPRATQGAGSSGAKNTGARKSDQADFADQLLGGKQGGVENQVRNDRKTSGRDSNREETRSNDRDRDSKSPSSTREKPSSEKLAKRDTPEMRAEARRKAKHEDRVESTRAPGSEYAPIVIEAPKKQEEPEMKLPDFFGKLDNKVEGGVKGTGKELSADVKAAAGETVDLLSSMKEGEQVSREQAMSQFMESMQEELGIPPEKILQALSNLDASALQAPPEETVGQFIDGLDLIDSSGTERATELYQDLLKTTGDSLLNEKVAGLDSSVNFDIMSSKDASMKKLKSSLDNMNETFFRKGGATDEPKKAQAALESMDAALAKLMRGQDLSANAPALGNAGLATMDMEGVEFVTDDSATSSTAQGASALAGLAASSQNPLAAALQAGSDEGDLSFLDSDADEIPLMAGQKEAASSFAKELAAEDSDLKELGSEDLKADISTELLADTDLSASATPIATSLAQGVKSASVTAPGDMMMSRQPTSADEQANIRDLIKNAQIMVKRGGGEMKVEMTPEGMGKVQLKVAVENGQVNVQMLTESDSAKRLLEKGMNELRTTLAAHDLKVETLRVDVGNDVSKQMDQQATQDQARQNARQFAQDFMGSFREQNQGFRQGLFEQSGWRSYGRNQRRENVGPEVSASVSAQGSAKSNGDKRLNVVA